MADLSLTATNVVLVSGPTQNVVLGATLTAGEAVYISNSTTNPPTVLAAKNDTAAHALFAGILLNGGAIGQPAVMAQVGCVVTIGGTTAIGTTYFVSSNAGGICPDADLTTGYFVTEIGLGITATQLKISGVSWGVAHA